MSKISPGNPGAPRLGDKNPPLTLDAPAASTLPSGWSEANADEIANSIRPSWAPDEVPPQTSLRARESESPGDGNETALALEGARMFRRSKRHRQRRAGLVVAGICVIFATLAAVSVFPGKRSDGHSRAANVGPSAPEKLSISPRAAADSRAKPPSVSSTTSARRLHAANSGSLRAAKATAETVRLQVTTNPPEAILYVDDIRVDNPYDAQVPRGQAVLLRAQAPGHATTERTLISDRQHIIALALRPTDKRHRHQQ